MKLTTHHQFMDIISKQTYNDPKRWEYIKFVQSLLQKLKAKTVLEAGPEHLVVCQDSDTVGLKDEKFTHDLTQVPWPFVDKQYDVFLALQVWEHLDGCQAKAFQEACRIATHVILSLPYKWMCKPNDCHYNIGLETIMKWAGGKKPYYKITDNTPHRIVCLWEG